MSIQELIQEVREIPEVTDAQRKAQAEFSLSGPDFVMTLDDDGRLRVRILNKKTAEVESTFFFERDGSRTES